MSEHELWKQINRNKTLRRLEQEGFERGEKQGKTMDVNLHEVWKSFQKQYFDLQGAYLQIVKKMGYPYESFSNLTNADLSHFKKCVADVRNVAGCLFLKIRDFETIQGLTKVLERVEEEKNHEFMRNRKRVC